MSPKQPLLTNGLMVSLPLFWTVTVCDWLPPFTGTLKKLTDAGNTERAAFACVDTIKVSARRDFIGPPLSPLDLNNAWFLQPKVRGV